MKQAFLYSSKFVFECQQHRRVTRRKSHFSRKLHNLGDEISLRDPSQRIPEYESASCLKSFKKGHTSHVVITNILSIPAHASWFLTISS